MKGNEVNQLRDIESLVSQDEDKSLSYVSTKLSVFNVAFHNLESAFLKDSGKEEEYDFIPFQCGSFVDMLIEASLYFKMDRSKKFLDVGCGPGTKVILANVLFDAHGIELRRSAVETANNYFCLKNVFQGDALKCEKYGEYDLLYFYRPLKSPSLQLALEEVIFEQMKPGALIAPMHTEMDWDSKTKRLSQYLYLKE